MLNSYVVNATNYIPVTTTPVEPPPTTVTQTPYKNFSIPGKIEAEDFDNGGEGVAYHDTDVANQGTKYRTTSVDVEGTTLINVGWTADGEWLEYTPASITSGKYKIEFEVASTVSTGSFNLQADGTTLGTVPVPNTGAWQTYKLVSFEADLLSTQKVLRLNILKGDVNINWIQFTPVTVTPPEPNPISDKVFDITKAPFFAKGNGQDNDGPAIQAAIDAAIKVSGKVIIPAANNYYKTTQTIYIQPKAPESQAYISIEGNGKYFSQIVYQGQSNSSAVVIIGLKGGSSIQGLHVKLGDGVSGSAAFDIGTNNPSGSTSGFTFKNCTAELNKGIGNVGFRVGKIDSGYGSDISQIDWQNSTCWGPHTLIVGQIGYSFVGANSLGFTLNSSAAVFCETGIRVTAGGVISLLGYLSSQNGTELWMSHSTQVAFFGGRFESSKKFLRVDQSANFPGVTISGALISDFKTPDGKLFEFLAPGGLTMDNVKIENSYDYDSRMFTLGNNGGTLSIRGGAFNATDPFVTPGGWRVKVENVVKLNRDYQSTGFFTNK